jgi:hypothetical protein
MAEDDPKEEPSPEPKEKEKASLAEEIESSIRKVLGNLLDSGEVTVEEKETPSEKEPDKPPSSRQEETDMEKAVREAVAKLKTETPPEPEKKAPPPETSPETFGKKVSRFMWGDVK